MLTTALRLRAAFVISLCTFSSITHATIVQFQTALGEIEVNLFDETTPATVANFLSYVESQAYNDSIFHRSVDGFIVQGGGFTVSGDFPGSAIPATAPVVNEPVYSNVRGTIAMAKLGGNPNSATNQWFFNLGDNSANLDRQNGGFTVFGQVMGEGMAVIDAIDALPRFNFSSVAGAYSELPLRDYTNDDAGNGTVPTDENLVLVSAITVIDAAADTAKDLTPLPNELINTLPTPAPPSGDSGGGGSTGYLFIGLLGLAVGLRRSRKRDVRKV